MPQALITVNSVTGSLTNVAVGSTVQLSNANIGGESTYLWTITYQPAGAADNIVGPTTQSPTLTVNKEDTYRVTVLVNSTLSASAVIGVRRVKNPTIRVPAAGETSEAGTNGWSQDLNYALDYIDTKTSDPGISVVSLGAPNLTTGSVVMFSGTTTIKLGLPGQEDVMFVSQSYATLLQNATQPLGIVVGAVTGSVLTSGTLAFVRRFGLHPLVVSGNIGDSVYLSDTGGVSNAPGTNTRLLGKKLSATQIYFDGSSTAASVGGTASGSFLGGNAWIDGGGKVRTTSSVAIDPRGTYAATIGTDVSFYVSGTTGLSQGNAARTVSVIGGDLIVSGAISGSHTQLANGASFLLAGGGISITTQSNGQVLISGSAQQITNLAGSGGTTVSIAGSAYTVSSSVGADVFGSYILVSANANDTKSRTITAGTNITFSDGGAGSTFTINAASVSGSFLGGNAWIDGGNKVRTTSSVAIDPTGGFAANQGTDVAFYVSGSVGLAVGSGARKIALFGGDIISSGSLHFVPLSVTASITYDPITNLIVGITPNNLTIQGQNAATGATNPSGSTGGNLNLYAGLGSQTGSTGNVIISGSTFTVSASNATFVDGTGIQRAAISSSNHGVAVFGGGGTDYKAYIGPAPGAETSAGALYFAPAATNIAGANAAIRGDSLFTYLNSPANGIFFYSSGAQLAIVTTTAFTLAGIPLIQWAATISSPTLNQAQQSGNTAAQPLTIQSQNASVGAAPGANANGGNLNLYAGLGYVTGTTGQIIMSSSLLQVTGAASFNNGLSGSLTQLQNGASYLLAGTNVTITSQSNGQVLIAATGGSTSGSFLGGNAWVDGGGKVRTTSSVAIDPTGGFAANQGTDVAFYVSGSQGLVAGSGARKVTLFGGDIVTSGSIHFAAPTTTNALISYDQITNLVTGVIPGNLTVQGQSAAAGATNPSGSTGGNLNLYAGLGSQTGSTGNVVISGSTFTVSASNITFVDGTGVQRAAISASNHGVAVFGGGGTDYKAYIGPAPGSESSAASLYFAPPGTNIANANFAIRGDSLFTYLNSPANGIFFYTGGSQLGAFSSTSFNLAYVPQISFGSGVTSPSVVFTQQVGNTPTSALTIQGQPASATAAPGANANGGNLQLNAGLGYVTGTTGNITLSGSLLQMSGGMVYTNRIITGSYVVDSFGNDMTLFLSMSGGTITLPKPTQGRRVTLKDISGSLANSGASVTLTGSNGSKFLEGLAGSYTMQAAFMKQTWEADQNTNWWIVG